MRYSDVSSPMGLALVFTAWPSVTWQYLVSCHPRPGEPTTICSLIDESGSRKLHASPRIVSSHLAGGPQQMSPGRDYVHPW